MLNRDEIERYGPPGFSAGQKEKDYAQHWILSYLGRQGFGGAFKGGTCLQKAFGLSRYSEDLDFTLQDAGEPDIDAFCAFLSSAGFGHCTFKRKDWRGSRSVGLNVEGPLYNGRELSRCHVSLDFGLEERLQLKTKARAIRTPYPDLMSYTLQVMALKEIAAEKVRALFTRRSARDLYDLQFLLKMGAKPSTELVRTKLERVGLNFSEAQLERDIKHLKTIWPAEMKSLAAGHADYAQAKKEVLDALKTLVRETG